MINRESAGLVVMTLVFLLLMGGVGAYVIVQVLPESGLGAGRTAATYRARGQESATSRQFAKAIDDLTKAIELEPDSPLGYVVRAEIFAKSSDHASAVRDYGTALDLDPSSLRASMGRARSRRTMGDTALAVEDYSAVLALDETNTTARRARGEARRALGDFDGAVADLGAIADNTGANLHSSLAWAQWGADRYDEALESFNHVIDRRRNWRSHDSFGRGVTCYHLGHFGWAAADLERVANDPRQGSDYARYYLWLTLHHLGLAERADAELRTFIENMEPRPRQRAGRWSLRIARFLIGDLPEAEFLSQAAAGQWLSAPEQLCEAYFYAGSVRQLAGDTATARDYFRRSEATNMLRYYEYYSSRAERAKMEEAE